MKGQQCYFKRLRLALLFATSSAVRSRQFETPGGHSAPPEKAAVPQYDSGSKIGGALTEDVE
jgi:hypothetical protein